MLLKGLGEVQSAPVPLQAAEMALIRLAYVSDLPTPGELVERLSGAAGPAPAAAPSQGAAPAPSNGGTPVEARAGSDRNPDRSYERGGPPPADSGPRASLARALPEALPEELPDELVVPRYEPLEAPAEAPPASETLQPQSFAEAVALVRDGGESILANHLMNDVHLVRFEPGRIEMRVTEAAPPNLAPRFGAVLEKACGNRWVITISQEAGEASLREQQNAAEAERRAAVMQHPLVQALVETFPDAKLVARRDRVETDRAEQAPDDRTDSDRGADEG
jgi:DNA polymerase-3 subunit gamma/tau